MLCVKFFFFYSELLKCVLVDFTATLGSLGCFFPLRFYSNHQSISYVMGLRHHFLGSFSFAHLFTLSFHVADCDPFVFIFSSKHFYRYGLSSCQKTLEARSKPSSIRRHFHQYKHDLASCLA